MLAVSFMLLTSSPGGHFSKLNYLIVCKFTKRFCFYGCRLLSLSISISLCEFDEFIEFELKRFMILKLHGRERRCMKRFVIEIAGSELVWRWFGNLNWKSTGHLRSLLISQHDWGVTKLPIVGVSDKFSREWLEIKFLKWFLEINLRSSPVD
jgi:hypothetical protein